MKLLIRIDYNDKIHVWNDEKHVEKHDKNMISNDEQIVKIDFTTKQIGRNRNQIMVIVWVNQNIWKCIEVVWVNQDMSSGVIWLGQFWFNAWFPIRRFWRQRAIPKMLSRRLCLLKSKNEKALIPGRLRYIFIAYISSTCRYPYRVL